MRKTILAAATVLAIGAAATAGGLIHDAWAQGAPGPGGPPGAPPPPEAPWMHHGPWMEHMRDHEMGRGGMHHGGMPFALFYRPEDRALSGADVQKIAEAFLLWNGNHTWKITGVTENQDNTVSFAIATQSGDVIARFAMDRKTGRVRRIG